MTNETQAFEFFLREREAAARAYVKGDAGPLGGLAARVSPATFFGPGGGCVRGTAAVATCHERDAALFGDDGETRFEVFASAAGDRVAYWTGLQHATVRMGAGEPRAMELRVTEVFLKEGHAWKLVHRHADRLASEPAPR